MRILKKIIIIVALLSFFEINAQTFKISKYEDYSATVSARKKQRDKAKYLGSKVVLDFYESDVKLTTDVENTTTIVLKKVSEDKYEAIDDHGTKAVLTLDTWVRYIRKGIITVYDKNNKKIGEVLFERD